MLAQRSEGNICNNLQLNLQMYDINVSEAIRRKHLYRIFVNSLIRFLACGHGNYPPTKTTPPQG